jgi:hypothetical protein
MTDAPDIIELWPDFLCRDFVAITPMRPIIFPRPLRVVGAARSGSTFVVIPLAELSTPLGTEPRKIQLWIPPSLGILTFKAPRRGSLSGSETARILKAYLDMVGVESAYLHANNRGEADTDHAGAVVADIRTGKNLFRPLDRFSPVNGRRGLELMIIEAHNFMMAVPETPGPDEELRAPPLLAVHVRALLAAIDGATRILRAYREQAHQPTTGQPG